LIRDERRTDDRNFVNKTIKYKIRYRDNIIIALSNWMVLNAIFVHMLVFIFHSLLKL